MTWHYLECIHGNKMHKKQSKRDANICGSPLTSGYVHQLFSFLLNYSTEGLQQFCSSNTASFPQIAHVQEQPKITKHPYRKSLPHLRMIFIKPIPNTST